MKKYLILCLTALTMLTAVSCSDDDNDSSPSAATTTSTNTVGVIVNGTKFAVGSSTRAFPSNWDKTANTIGTSFSIGDSIGIWKYNSSGTLVTANMKYIYDGKKWNNINGGMEYDATAIYYAMYPYVPDDSLVADKRGTVAETVTSSTDANTFFADIISKWKVRDDQTNADDFSYSDLMVSKGVVVTDDGTGTQATSGTTHSIQFTMTHTMSLAVMQFTPIQYICDVDENFSSDNAYKWDETFSGNFGGSYHPHLWGGYYIYILPNNTSRQILPQYGADIFPLNIYVKEAGKYSLSQMGGSKPYTLTIGDIAYADGSFTHEGYTAPGKRLIGILGYVNNNGDDVTEKSHGYTHGLIVSKFCKEEFNYNDMGNTNTIVNSISEGCGIYDGIEQSSLLSDIEKGQINSATATIPLDNFKGTHSDWFIGSLGQYYAILNAFYKYKVAKDPTKTIGAESYSTNNKFGSEDLYRAFEALNSCITAINGTPPSSSNYNKGIVTCTQQPGGGRFFVIQYSLPSSYIQLSVGSWMPLVAF